MTWTWFKSTINVEPGSRDPRFDQRWWTALLVQGLCLWNSIRLLLRTAYDFSMPETLSVTLIWIPGHTGIWGNELADEAAKAALSSTVSTMKCPVSDFYPELTKHYREVWRAEWDGYSANKLHSVKPHLGYCSATHLSYWNNCSGNKLWAICPTVGNQHYNKSLARKDADYVLVTPGWLTVICYQEVTPRNVQLVSVRSLSITSSLTVVLLPMFETNTSMSRQWKIYLKIFS